MKIFNAVVRMLTLGVLTAIAGTAAAQPAYPSKPIRFIYPYTASTNATTKMDTFAKIQHSQSWGQYLPIP